MVTYLIIYLDALMIIFTGLSILSWSSIVSEITNHMINEAMVVNQIFDYLLYLPETLLAYQEFCEYFFILIDQTLIGFVFLSNIRIEILVKYTPQLGHDCR